MNVIRLLDRPIAFHRCLVDITGSANAALLLSQAIYWHNRPTRESNDGWWYKSREDWYEETGLSRKELETARRQCSGILMHRRRGIPPYTYYKLNVEELEKRLLETGYTEPIIRPETDRSYGPKGAVCMDRKGPSIGTETKAEIKTDISTPPASELALNDSPAYKSKARCSKDEMSSFFKELGLPQSDSEFFFYKCEANGWTHSGKPIKDWKAHVRSWNAAGYMPSQKKNKSTQQPAKTDWEYEKWIKSLKSKS